METSQAATSSAGQTGAAQLPWHLIPSFKPGTTDLSEYSQKMAFLAQMWPSEHMSQLAPRAALLCEGSAFQKIVRLDASRLKTSDTKGVELLVKTLGGVWGKTTLEDKYEKVEKALYGTTQKHDETNESYLARHEILFEDVITQGASLTDLRAYILLRNSGLSAEDKKRVILESGGSLDYGKVTSAIRMLGSRFFQDVQGVAKTSQRSKVYDVNTAVETEEDTFWTEDHTSGGGELGEMDGWVDVFLSEGDEDAILVSQFEESLIDALQSDTEMSILMSSYTEARKRLLEKSRNRGFWPTPKGKGMSKGKGKSKSRKPLAQRIAESHCRKCGQKGHWKAECPQGKSSQVANAMVSSTTHDVDEDIIFVEQDDHHIESLHPVEASVFAAEKEKGGNHTRYKITPVVDRFKQRLTQILFPTTQVSLNRKPDEKDPMKTTTTPSEKEGMNGSGSEGLRVVEEHTPGPRDPFLLTQEVSKDTIKPVIENHEAVFASFEAYGIVDLGASQTVMGQHQVDELLRALPKRAREQHYFAEVNMTFRFGNNGTVDCTQALFVPVGGVWLKIAIVASRTPFLISNNVFRSLGAVIDTANQEVYFRKLDCSVPLKLSERKLFLLNLCDLIRRAEGKRQPTNQGAAVVLNTVSESQSEKGPQISEQTTIDSEQDTHIAKKGLINDSSPRPKECPKCVAPECETSHVVSGQLRVSSAFREGSSSESTDGTVCKVPADVDAGTPGTDDQIRNSQVGSTLPPGGSRGSIILPVVPEVLGVINETPTSRVCLLPGEVHGTSRAGESNGNTADTLSQDGDTQASAQVEKSSIGCFTAQLGRDRRGAGLYHGDEAGGVISSDGPNGGCSESDCSPATTAVDPSAEPTSIPVKLVVGSEAEKSFLQGCVDDMYAKIHSEGNHHGWEDIFQNEDIMGKNWVKDEMHQYFIKKGYMEPGVTVPSPSQPRCEFLEIYCSSESQLTKQSLRQGGKAIRFGLNQGDLRYQESRHKLYDIIYHQRPRDIWMSPACKAWNKWSIFNANRSISTARKIMLAREDDEVHLLLCAAICDWQCNRGQDYHFHLEQPVGSEMLYEEPLQQIMSSTKVVRCDMCVAGNLLHPQSKKPLQKGAQILTTSEILARALEPLKCHHQHDHDQIARSYKGKGGKREAISKYTELYTATFANRVIRALCASQKVREKRLASHSEIVMAGEEAEAEESSAKRRRLAEKQNRPPAYAEPHVTPPTPESNASESRAIPMNENQSEQDIKPLTIDELTQKCLAEAPRVGKIVFEGGSMFDKIQEAFPDKRIRVVEIAKGVDKFRKSPVKLVKGEAPQRYAFGTKRDGNVFDGGQWEDWEQKSVRQLTTKSPPMRMLVTVFGREVSEMSHPIRSKNPESDRSHRKEQHDLEESELPASKRPRRESQEIEIPQPCVGEKTHQEDQEKPKDIPYQTHGPKFQSLSKEKQQWLRKIHINLGHPNRQKLTSVLKDQGYSQDLIDALEDFHCSSCFENSLPKTARPASLPEIREFNDCVGCDLVSWTSKAGKVFTFVHFIDMATNFHQAIEIHQTDAEGLFEGFKRAWLHWAGACKQLITDNESALCSEKFETYMRERNIHLRTVAAYAHWQNGKTERHGEILQQMLKRCDSDNPINTGQEFSDMLEQCCNAKNSLSRHRGYTPEILVLGKSQPLPATNSADEPDAAQYLAEQESCDGLAFRKQLERREAARKAFIEMDHHERIRRATLRKHRPFRGSHQPGSFVMFWRPGRGETPGRWTGPAQVIIQESTSVVWISHASRVYRVAPEHVRLLSSREMNQHLPDIEKSHKEEIPSIIGPGVFQYEDMIGPPESPGIITELGDHEVPSPSPNNENPESITIQPDSEPSAPSELGSLGITPTTPAESMCPEGETSQGVATDAAAIPVPTSDEEDALAMEDFWIVQNDRIIRVHNQPRRELYQPHQDGECPIDILTVEATRTTIMRDSRGDNQTIQDRWDIDNGTAPKQQWTGVTVFRIQNQEECEAFNIVDEEHVGKQQGWTYDILITEHDIQELSKPSTNQVSFLATTAKRQRSEVKVRDLTPTEIQEFEKAKLKEVDQWLDTGTVRAILRHKIPEANLLRSRWILTWKELDPQEALEMKKSHKAKARLVILGYEDPNLAEIPRDSPTLQKESRSLILQYCASRQWSIRSFDVKTAFLRGSRRDNRVLGVEPPIELRQRMGLQEAETCELLKSAYGLVNAPYLWYQELKETLINLKFKMSPLDPCLFTLASADGKVHGCIGIHVDDGLCCGDSVFDKALADLERKFPFGAKKQGTFVFTGIHIHQEKNGNIHLNQKDYINNIEAIHIDRDRRKMPEATITDKEKQGLRGLIGSLQYAASNTRPDLSSRLSLLQARINCAQIKDLMEGNRLLGDAKKHDTVTITYENIPVEEIRFLAYSDASFATREKQQSQKGGLILAANSDVLHQKPARASPIVWYSKKISRIVASTLAAETYALSHAVDLLDWIRLGWAWLVDQRINWQKPEEVWSQGHSSIVAVDCKSLYDVITKNTTPQCQEHRTLIEALVIKDHVKSGIALHWVHSAAQLADALTKAMDTYSLRKFLENHWCCLHDIDEILKSRADRKAQKQWIEQNSTKEGEQK